MNILFHYTSFLFFLSFFTSCNKTKRKIVEKWENGNDKLVYEFKKEVDTLNFKKVFYYENGLIRCEENYNNGIINGTSLYLDSNGKITSIDLYQNGFKKEFTEYYNKNIIKRRGVFKKLDTIDTFDSTGILLKRVIKPIGEITEFYINGKPKTKVIMSLNGKEDFFEWTDSL